MTVQYQGVWSLQNAAQLQSTQRWVTDPLFENTTLLLQADDAANGAQNNTFLDSSSNNFAITRNGNTTQGSFTPFSLQPGAWSNFFVASASSTIGFANNAAFQFGAPSGNANDFVVEFFVYPTTTAISAPVHTGYTSGTTYWGFNFNRTTGGVNTAGYVQFYLTDNFNVTATTGLISNQQNHICAVRTGTTVSLFVNGIRQATGTSSVNPNPTGLLYVGGEALSLGRYLDGYVSNLRIIKGSTLPYDANSLSITVPTSQLTAITGTTILTCQSNRFVDNSSNGLSIATTGTPSVQAFSPFAPQFQWTPSVIGGSGYFDGTGDFLQAPSNAAFNLGTGDFTLECWVYATSTPSDVGIFESRSDGNTATTNGFTLTAFSSSVIRIYSAAVLISSSGTNYVNSWCHVAVTRVSGTFNLYINGVSQGTSGTARTLSNPEAIIGAGRYGGTSAVNAFFPGNIANFRIVKGQALTTGNFTPPTAPVTATSVGWTGANVASSITGTVSLLLNFTNAGIYDGTMKNNLETVGNAQVSTAVVKYGSGSMFFDGTGDYLDSPSIINAQFGTGDLTIEGWLYLNSLATLQVLFEFRASNGATYGQIYVTTGGVLRFYLPTDVGTSNTITTGVWTHFAITRAASTLRMFINGVQGHLVSNPAAMDAARLRIGADVSGSNGLNGYLDDVRFTKGVARYTANFIPPSVALPRQ